MYPNTINEALLMIIDLQREQIHNIKEIEQYRKEIDRLKGIVREQHQELEGRRKAEPLTGQAVSDLIPPQQPIR